MIKKQISLMYVPIRRKKHLQLFMQRRCNKKKEIVLFFNFSFFLQTTHSQEEKNVILGFAWHCQMVGVRERMTKKNLFVESFFSKSGYIQFVEYSTKYWEATNQALCYIYFMLNSYRFGHVELSFFNKQNKSFLFQKIFLEFNPGFVQKGSSSRKILKKRV